MSDGGAVAMITDAARAAMPTDDQLHVILRFVARICLEVERGLRPPAHLHGFVDPGTTLRPDAITLGRFRGGPVLDDHIGQPHLSRLGDSHIVATVVTRIEAERWGALTLRLRAYQGRWWIADLQRLLAGLPLPHRSDGARAARHLTGGPSSTRDRGPPSGRRRPSCRQSTARGPGSWLTWPSRHA